MQRVEISRADFEQQFGFKPADSSLGMVFCTPAGIVVHEYIFTDDEPHFAPLEIAELERMYKLCV